jgi:hypothetical protein
MAHTARHSHVDWWRVAATAPTPQCTALFQGCMPSCTCATHTCLYSAASAQAQDIMSTPTSSATLGLQEAADTLRDVLDAHKTLSAFAVLSRGPAASSRGLGITQSDIGSNTAAAAAFIGASSGEGEQREQHEQHEQADFVGIISRARCVASGAGTSSAHDGARSMPMHQLPHSPTVHHAACCKALLGLTAH